MSAAEEFLSAMTAEAFVNRTPPDESVQWEVVDGVARAPAHSALVLVRNEAWRLPATRFLVYSNFYLRPKKPSMASTMTTAPTSQTMLFT